MIFVERSFLYECADNLIAAARKKVNDRYLWHGVAAGLQTCGGACHVNEHLAGESRIVYAHVERQTLVLRLAAHALAGHVNAVTHVAHFVNRVYSEHVQLIVSEIVISLDFLCHLVK